MFLRLKQINTFHTLCVRYSFAPCSSASHTHKHTHIRTRSACVFHFLLGHFIVFSVSFRLSFPICSLLLLATGCACTHSCALTSVNQVKIDIFMLVSRCVGMWRGAVAVVAYPHLRIAHTFMYYTHFDFNLMVIILQKARRLSALCVTCERRTFTRSVKAYISGWILPK